jgi:3-oxoacyl-[acyl-carrier-protein] synthase II
VGRAFGFRGPNRALTTACSSGNAAIAFACDQVRGGRADLMLAGGVDVYNRINLAGFNRLLAAAPEVCAPFSKGRKGLIPGEGCAVLVLEDLEAARRRGAHVYAELLGYGVSSDGLHPTIPDAGGIARAMAAALADSGLAAGDVDYISAHGTGTELNDRVETKAIHAVFGSEAARIPVSSIKSMLGHAMGAASALEAVACCLSLETGVLPPTMNHVPGDPDCDLDYVPNQARQADPQAMLSNAFAFGGSNAVIALAKPSPAPRPPEPETEPCRVVITGLGRCAEADPLALAETLMPEKDLRYLDRPMAYAACAAKRAFDSAGLDPASLGDEGGVILDNFGELDSFLPFFRELVLNGPLALEPRLFPNVLSTATANRVAVLFALKAVNWTFAGSHPGGHAALAGAFSFLRRAGRGAVLAGAVQGLPLPGQAAAAGAFLVVVETRDGALRRGARVIAEVEGYEEGFDPGARGGAAAQDSGLESWLRRSPAPGARAELASRGWWGGQVRLRMAGPA